MADTERPTILTDVEMLALEVRERLPAARAVEALGVYATVIGLSVDEAERFAEQIREMSPQQQRRMRKALTQAAKLQGLLPGIVPVRDDESKLEVDELRGFDGSEQATLDKEDAPFPLSEPSKIPVETIDVAPEKDLGVQEPEETQPAAVEAVAIAPEVSPSGKAWVVKLIPDFNFDNKDAEQVAGELYERMGRPKTRMFKGKRIDPIKRIQMRLEGRKTNDIAIAENVSYSSVEAWFRAFVERRFASDDAEDIVSLKSESEEASEAEVNETQVVEFELSNLLAHAGFSSDESYALIAAYKLGGVSNEGEIDTASLKTAKAKLQKLLASNANRLDSGDTDLLASLRMITNGAFGHKTLMDVYYKLHGKDPATKVGDVSAMLRDGIIKLIEEK